MGKENAIICSHICPKEDTYCSCLLRLKFFFNTLFGVTNFNLSSLIYQREISLIM